MQLDDGLRRLIAPVMGMPREDGGEGVSEKLERVRYGGFEVEVCEAIP